MGLFLIDGEYDFVVHVSPTLADNILNNRYINPETISIISIIFEQETIMSIYVDNEYFDKVGMKPFTTITIDDNNEESIHNRFIKQTTIVPQKSFNAYMKKINFTK